MALQDELNEIVSQAEESDDLEQLKKQKEMERVQQFLSQGGLGGLLGSIFGAAAGGVAWVSGGRSSA